MNHSEYRYDKRLDIVLVRCEITDRWWTVQEPEGASYCLGCSETVSVPVEHQRPQTEIAPSVTEQSGDDYEDPELNPNEIGLIAYSKALPCGHTDHENGGPADYGPECRR